MPARKAGDDAVAPAVAVRLIGPFAVSVAGRVAGPWPRPTARRLCQLVLVSPGRRLSREAACEALFPSLAPEAAANALSKALSLARSVLGELGPAGAGLLCADRRHIWAAEESGFVVDLDAEEHALRRALSLPPGNERDGALLGAISHAGTVLEEEPEADWACRVRERLDYLRQEARLALARDRARGAGRSRPEEVIEAWLSCLETDPVCEEAASALMRIYAAQGRRALATATYERCRAALAELGLVASPALEEVRAVAGPDPLPPARPPAGSPAGRQREERRLVSVLFVELSSTDSAGSRTDPEDVRELVGAALAEVIAQVEALRGTVTSVSGHGLSALFGAPEAHEDDPERALRAALRILAAAAASASGSAGPSTSREPLSVRVAVETGTAIVGPIVGGERSDFGAIGEVVGEAAALQSVARAGSVLVGPATRAATEGIFDWGPSEEVATLPGRKPIVASYLVRPKPRPLAEPGRRRLAASAALAGREGELAELTAAVRDTVAGKGRIVVVVGEPGLGKTRLVAECRKRFMAWVGAGSGRLPLWLEGRCASYASATPYGAYQQLLCRFVGAQLEEGEAVVRPALERALHAVLGDRAAELGPLLARLLGLPAGADETRLARLAPEELQRATFSAVRSLISRLVERGPTVLALEDLHWADPTSLRLTGELARLVALGPLLVLATRRPEPDPGVSDLEAELGAELDRALRVLELEPIPPEAERNLARRLLGGEVADEVIEVVCEGVDGNPLFLEERVASLLETGRLERQGRVWRLGRGEAGPVPEALERLIRSRVDRFGPASREAILAATVLGEEFERSALASVSELDSGLDEAVDELVSGGLLALVRSSPEPAYRFRHVLIRDATYNGLMRSQRRQLHARAAWNIEASAAQPLEEVAAVLGHHYALAGERARAAHFLQLAGDNAARAFANEEAIASYRHALALLDEEPRGAAGALEDTGSAVQLRLALADVLALTGRRDEARELLHEGIDQLRGEDSLRSARLQYHLGILETSDHRYDEAIAAFDAADELIGPDPAGQAPERVRLWLEVQLNRVTVHYWRNEPELARPLLDAARPVVEERGGAAEVARFYNSLVMQQLRQRRYQVDAQMVADMRESVAAAHEAGDDSLVGWTTFCFGFLLLWFGDLDEAHLRLDDARQIAEDTGDVLLRARCLCYLNVTALRRHEVESVRRLAPEVSAAAVAADYPEYVAAATATQAWVAWRDGRPTDVVRAAETALALWATTVVSYSWYWLCLWPLLAVHLDAGHVEQAVVSARQLLAPAQQRLPDELDSLVASACGAFDSGDLVRARRLLAEALQLACEMRYA